VKAYIVIIQFIRLFTAGRYTNANRVSNSCEIRLIWDLF